MGFLEYISLISDEQWNEYKLGRDIYLPAWTKYNKLILYII